MTMHGRDAVDPTVVEAIVAYALERIRLDPPPLDRSQSPATLSRHAGVSITHDGIGGAEALRRFVEVLAPACVSVDHPRFLAFVPAAPTEASVLFDLIVAASSIYAGSWLEGAGAVFAENEALRWLADLAGFPPGAGGVFVSGGTAGNLSALIAARWAWRHRHHGDLDRVRGLMLTSAGAHSSIMQAASAMDADVIIVPADHEGRLDAAHLEQTVADLSPEDRERLFAIAVTAGTTNAGVIDDLMTTASVCREYSVWMHVDGAYGAAALAAPSVRHRFAGIEYADSLVVDPHKWLFAPYDCCALLYRDPDIARAAHTQRAPYLEVLHSDDPANEPWNSSDYAHHLSRRARGLPLWFSLATHGSDAYRDAVEATLACAQAGAQIIAATPYTELVQEPELSVVLFRRLGWSAEDYREWSDRLLAQQYAFVMPTTWKSETVARFCLVNPVTTPEDLAGIIATMA